MPDKDGKVLGISVPAIPWHDKKAGCSCVKCRCRKAPQKPQERVMSDVEYAAIRTPLKRP